MRASKRATSLEMAAISLMFIIPKGVSIIALFIIIIERRRRDEEEGGGELWYYYNLL